jgi:hypothetical protein
MSDTNDKLKHSKRIHQKENHVSRQMDIRKAHSFPDDEAHKYHKMSGTSCGKADCAMCGNPRKFFKEETMQEKSFKQTENWDE